MTFANNCKHEGPFQITYKAKFKSYRFCCSQCFVFCLPFNPVLAGLVESVTGVGKELDYLPSGEACWKAGIISYQTDTYIETEIEVKNPGGKETFLRVQKPKTRG